MPFVIAEPTDVTPEWLTNILRNNGALDHGEVAGVKVLFTKPLQVSRVVRLAIDYSQDASKTAPPTLFLKLSKPDSALSASNESEIEFYEAVGSEIGGPPLICCYDAAFSADTNQSHLLMEDLFESHTQPKDGQWPSPVDCRLAMESLSSFHSRWWHDSRVGRDIGRVFDENWLRNFTADLETSVENFLAFLGNDISIERQKTYERMLRLSHKIWGRLTNRAGLTITNGDLHWWNFLFPKDPRREQTRLIDWQLWHIDLGARDLAFLIALGGFADRSPEMERDLIQLYHRSLLAHGVENYNWNEFWDDYRWSAIRNLNIPVIFWSQGKHQSTWRLMLERAFQAFSDLNCDELLSA